MDPSITVNIAISATITRYRKTHNLSMDAVVERLNHASPELNLNNNVFKNKACPTNTANEFKTSELSALIQLTDDDTIERAFKNLRSQTSNDANVEDVVGMLINLGIDQGNALAVVKQAISDGKVTYRELKSTTDAISASIAAYRDLERALVAMANNNSFRSVA